MKDNIQKAYSSFFGSTGLARISAFCEFVTMIYMSRDSMTAEEAKACDRMYLEMHGAEPFLTA